MNKEEKTKIYKSISSKERQDLILMNMKAREGDLGSEVSKKNYNSDYVYELIHIANCFPELKDKDY